MKTFWKMVLFFIITVMVGCNHLATETMHEPSLQQLAVIDSVIQTRPDSALIMLLDKPVDDYYYQLLLSEALYKNDYPQLNRYELLEAMDYYDSVCNLFLAARCHYMNGVGYYEMDSSVYSCEEYIKALEIMESNYGENELEGEKAKFMALTHTHLCQLFSDQYLHEQAIFFGQRALPYYNRYVAEARHVAWVLEIIGNQYHMLEQLDSALYYYDKALEILPDTNNVTYRDITAAKLYLVYVKGEKAESIIQKLIALCLLSENAQECFMRYAMVGDIYFREGDYDRAWPYLDTVFSSSKNLDLRKQSAEWLAEICSVQANETEFIKYSSFLMPFANIEENQSEIKSLLTKLKNNYCQKRLERKHQQRVRKIAFRYGMIFVSLITLVLVIVSLYYKSKRREKNLERQITIERGAHQVQQSALSARLKKSNRKVQDLTESLKTKEARAKQQNVVAVAFEEEPICLLVLEKVREGQFKAQMKCSVYESYALEKTHLLELRITTDRHFNNYTTRLKKDYSRLTNMDLDYCCLLLLGLTNADLSALMQREYNTVSERINKLIVIFGVNNSITQFLRVFAVQ